MDQQFPRMKGKKEVAGDFQPFFRFFSEDSNRPNIFDRILIMNTCGNWTAKRHCLERIHIPSSHVAVMSLDPIDDKVRWSVKPETRSLYHCRKCPCKVFFSNSNINPQFVEIISCFSVHLYQLKKNNSCCIQTISLILSMQYWNRMLCFCNKLTFMYEKTKSKACKTCQI